MRMPDESEESFDEDDFVEGERMDIDEGGSQEESKSPKRTSPVKKKKELSYIERSKEVGRIGPVIAKLD